LAVLRRMEFNGLFNYGDFHVPLPVPWSALV
jgi:hypothetical protein